MRREIPRLEYLAFWAAYKKITDDLEAIADHSAINTESSLIALQSSLSENLRRSIRSEMSRVLTGTSRKRFGSELVNLFNQSPVMNNVIHPSIFYDVVLSRKMKELSLRLCSLVPDDGVLPIAVKRSPNIKTLHLSYMMTTSFGLPQIPELKNFERLSTLSLSYMKSKSDLINLGRAVPRLKHLKLHFCSPTDLELLMILLGENAAKILEINWNDIHQFRFPNEWTAPFSSTLCTFLVEDTAEGPDSDLNPARASVLACFLRHMPILQTISWDTLSSAAVALVGEIEIEGCRVPKKDAIPFRAPAGVLHIKRLDHIRPNLMAYNIENEYSESESDNE